jgi:hypothetical protein
MPKDVKQDEALMREIKSAGRQLNAAGVDILSFVDVEPERVRQPSVNDIMKDARRTNAYLEHAGQPEAYSADDLMKLQQHMEKTQKDSAERGGRKY